MPSFTRRPSLSNLLPRGLSNGLSSQRCAQAIGYALLAGAQRLGTLFSRSSVAKIPAKEVNLNS